MNEVRTRIRVGPDHRVTGSVPPEVPPGEHDARIDLRIAGEAKPFVIEGFPVDHGPWDDGVALRRADLYGDDGR